MVRWSYLVPRMIILGLIALAVWLGMDPLVRYSLISAGQKVTGAKIEIRQVRSSLKDGRIYLNDVRIADPKDPMKNLLQADIAYIKLDPGKLLQREIVIERGTASSVMFGVPRTESGSLDSSIVHSDVKESPLMTMFQFDEKAIQQKWLDSFQSGIAQVAHDNLKTVQLSKEMREQWPNAIVEQQRRIEQLSLLAGSIEDRIKERISNPLRDLKRIPAAIEDYNVMLREFSAIKTAITQLQQKANSDRQKLLQAKRHDENNLKNFVATHNQFDSHTVSQLLLNETQERYMTEIMDWFRWFESTVPNPDEDFYPIRARGTNIVLKDVPPRPRFLIKSLDLDGQGHLAGRHLNFAGVARNWSTEPHRHDEPMTLQLRAQGQNHLIFDCVLDRRTPDWVNNMRVQCPDLEINPQTLGSKETLLVTMGNSKMQAEINIKSVAGRLTGNMKFRHSDVALHVDHLNPLAGGQEVALLINQDVASLKSFETYVELSGTTDAPVYEFRSDLGTQFAATMNRVIENRLGSQMVEQRARLSDALDKEIEELDKTIQSHISEISRVVREQSATIAELQKAVPKLDGESIFR